MKRSHKQFGFIEFIAMFLITIVLQGLVFGGTMGVLQGYIKKFSGAVTSLMGGASGVSTDCYLPDEHWKNPSSDLTVATVKQTVTSYKNISNAANDAKLQKLLDTTRTKGFNPAVALAVWGKESTYGTNPAIRKDPDTGLAYEFGYLLKGHGGFEKQLEGALNTFARAAKQEAPYNPKTPGQPIQVYWINTYTPSSDPANAGDRKTLFSILKQAVSSQVVCTELMASGGVADGSMDFRNFGPGQNEFVGRWTNVDQIFSHLGGKSPAAVGKSLVRFDWLGVKLQMNKEAAAAMKQVEKDFLATGTKYTIRQKDTSGYFWRENKNNLAVRSPHATGMALDVNWNSNGNYNPRPASCSARASNCCPHDIPKALSDAFEKNGFFWGAKFKNVCDAMHFQYGGNYN